MIEGQNQPTDDRSDDRKPKPTGLSGIILNRSISDRMIYQVRDEQPGCECKNDYPPRAVHGLCFLAERLGSGTANDNTTNTLETAQSGSLHPSCSALLTSVDMTRLNPNDMNETDALMTWRKFVGNANFQFQKTHGIRGIMYLYEDGSTEVYGHDPRMP